MLHLQGETSSEHINLQITRTFSAIETIVFDHNLSKICKIFSYTHWMLQKTIIIVFTDLSI